MRTSQQISSAKRLGKRMCRKAHSDHHVCRDRYDLSAQRYRLRRRREIAVPQLGIRCHAIGFAGLDGVLRNATCPWAACVLLLLVYGSVSLAAEGNQDAWRDRFQANAVSGWEQLRQSAPTQVSQNYTYRLKATDGKEVNNKQRRQFWLSDRAMKLCVDSYEPSGKWMGRQVFCVNADYAFVAAQPVQGARYFLKKHGRDPATIDEVRSSIVGRVFYLGIPYRVQMDRRTLPEVVASGDFELISCSEYQPNSSKLVEVHYNFKPTGLSARQDPSIRHSISILDPNANWRVVKSTVTCEQGKYDLDVSYAPDQDGRWLMTRAVSQGTLKSATNVETSDFDSVSHQPVPPSEFYLSSVGLPEVPSAGNTRFWRLVLIGGNFIVIGLLLLVVHQRRKKRA